MGEYLNWKGFGLRNWARDAVRRMPDAQSLVNCNECGECEDKCPNSLPIRVRLKELQTLLED